MKSVEKTVVPNVKLVSNLNYAQPVDRSDEPVAITSQLKYLQLENRPEELGGFRDLNGVVFRKMGESKDFVGAALSNVEPLMK